MFSQSLILVQSWPLSSSCVSSVWVWFRVDHFRPFMFSQSLILVQSWPLSSSYVFPEFDFGSELIIVVLLCLLRVWFWFRVDHCRPLMFPQFDFGSELTIVVLLCFLRVWFWFRVEHCRPLMFSQSLIFVQSWPGIVVLLCFLRVWFWFRVDHCRPLMFTQSLILVQSWPLSSSCVSSVWFWFRVDHCRPLMFSQSLILVQSWPLSSSYVYSEFDFGSELTIVVLLCFLRVWFWFSVDHCRPLMFTQSLILVQSWPLSSSYVYSEFDFGSVLNIVVLLCLLRVWFWFRVDHCRPLMFSQSLILVQSWPGIVVLLCFLRV